MNHRIYHQVQLLGKIANPNLWDLTPIPYAWSVYDQDVGNENDIKVYTRADIIKKNSGCCKRTTDMQIFGIAL